MMMPRSLTRTLIGALATMATLTMALATAGPAAAAEHGGATWSTAVPLPVAIPGAFVGDNTGSSNAKDIADSRWANTTWWSFTPADDMVLTIRAHSVDPEGWDNTLEVRLGADGSLVGHNDDSYDLDAMVTVSLTGGTNYRLGLGAYTTHYSGTAELSLSDRPPDAPADVAAVAGERSATVSWSAPDDNFAPITRYDVYCTPDGEPEVACGSVAGTPPAPGRTVTGLTAGIPHTFRVTATNGNGESALSASSEPITPAGVRLTASPAASAFGDDVTLRANVSPTPAPGTGAVAFSRGGVALADPVPVVDGEAELLVTELPVGASTLRAEVSGDGVTAASDELVHTVAKGAQTITWNGPVVASTGSAMSLVATATSGLPVAAAADGSCALDGPKVRFSSTGMCMLTLGQAGDASWEAAPDREVEIAVVDPLALPAEPTPIPTSGVTPPRAALDPTPVGGVHRIYLALFGRVADDDGLAYWVDRSASGTPMATIVTRFVTSTEWKATHGAPTGVELIDVLYRVVLGRAADPAGRSFWARQLATGTLTEDRLVWLFVESPEMQARIAAALALG